MKEPITINQTDISHYRHEVEDSTYTYLLTIWQPQEEPMGHHYRERHETPATTRSTNLAGLGANKSTVPSDDWTLEELRQYAKDNDFAVSGNKADLIARLTKA